MKLVAWTLQIVVAVAFIAAGSLKLITPKAELTSNMRMGWTEDFSETQIKLIGAAEVAGALGLILPAATGIAPVLTPIAAGGLAIIMGGAVATHMRRGEPPIVPLVLLLLAALIAWLRLRMLGSAKQTR